MSELLLSVIVPVYNAAATLEKCAASVLDQAPEAAELILVDDGSADDSPALCDRLAAQDGRVRVIHQKNGGASAARNAGLAAAKGRYVQFVDADDWVDTAALEERYFDDRLESAAAQAAVTVTAAYETLDPAAFWDALSLSRAEG